MKEQTNQATTIMVTGSGATWDTSKPVRTSIFKPCKELGYYPICTLTGRFEDHVDAKGETWSMVEVQTQYDDPAFIHEDFVSQ